MVVVVVVGLATADELLSVCGGACELPIKISERPIKLTGAFVVAVVASLCARKAVEFWSAVCERKRKVQCMLTLWILCVCLILVSCAVSQEVDTRLSSQSANGMRQSASEAKEHFQGARRNWPRE